MKEENKKEIKMAEKIETKIEEKVEKKIKLIRDNIYGLRDILEEIKKLDLDDTKFNYIMSKNLKLFQNECTEMDELDKPSQKFLEFDNKRMDMLKNKYAEKDKDNNPIVIYDNPKRPQIKLDPKLAKEFEEKLNILVEEYKEEIEKRNSKRNEFIKFVTEEIPEKFLEQIFKFTVIIGEDSLPTNLPKGLKQKYIDALNDIILIEKK
jgi:hypothetical protein